MAKKVVCLKRHYPFRLPYEKKLSHTCLAGYKDEWEFNLLFVLPPSLNTVHCLITSLFPGPDSAMLVPILLGSLTGFAVLGSAFISLWLHHRQKTKDARCPQLGEIHGL